MVSKKFLIISESIDVNDSSASKGRVAIINNLVKIGCGVKVLHYTRKTIHLPQIECVEIKEKTLTFFYVLSRIQRVIQRIFKLNLAKYIEPLFGFSFTFFNDVNSIKSALKKIDIQDYDYILTLSKGASFRPHFAVNKMPKLHSKWLAYVHDPYPFSKYPIPYDWNEPGYEIKEAFFKDLSGNAKHAIFPSVLLKDWMGEVFNNFNKTGTVIPHQNFEIDLSGFSAPAFFNEKMFNILHAGSLMKPRNPEGLLKGFQKFLAEVPEASEDTVLYLIGNASYHKKLVDTYNDELKNLYFHSKSMPFKEVYWLQKHVSVNIILEAKAEISPFLPGKFPHCVAANKPILHLGPRNSELLRLMGSDYPYHSTIDDASKIAEIIGTLYKLWKANKNDFKLNRTDLEHYISSAFLEEQIHKLENE